MGGSYNWTAWIFDQYAVQIERDAAVALFDRTNVFTMNRSVDHLPRILPRGKDCSKVTRGLIDLMNEEENIRIRVTSQEKEVRR